MLDKWFPTTKYCVKCGSKIELELKDRIFECPKCKTKEDRDIHAANNMIYFYLHSINAPGTDVNMLVGNKISYKEFVAKQESTTSSVQCQFIYKYKDNQLQNTAYISLEQWDDILPISDWMECTENKNKELIIYYPDIEFKPGRIYKRKIEYNK